MDELKKQAEELGIKVDGRWSAERLQAEIGEKLAADPEPELVDDLPEPTPEQEVEVPVAEVFEGLSAPAEPEPELEFDPEAKAAADAEIQAEIQARFDASQEAEIIEPEAPTENSVTVINLQANPMKVLGLASYGSTVFTERQLDADPRLYAKIKRGVDLGILKVEG